MGLCIKENRCSPKWHHWAVSCENGPFGSGHHRRQRLTTSARRLCWVSLRCVLAAWPQQALSAQLGCECRSWLGWGFHLGDELIVFLTCSLPSEGSPAPRKGESGRLPPSGQTGTPRRPLGKESLWLSCFSLLLAKGREDSGF